MTEVQPHIPPNQKTNGKAITALVLGILGIILPYIGFILGIIAIIMGRSAIKEIKLYGEAGHGMAMAGFVCGIVSVSIYGIVFLLFLIGVATLFTFS